MYVSAARLFSMYNVNDACSLKNIVARPQNASEIALNDQVGNYLITVIYS